LLRFLSAERSAFFLAVKLLKLKLVSLDLGGPRIFGR
jgi:hypothetical protein